MKRTILWQASGFALCTLAGTLLHFLYDWTGGSILAAPFSGVNESTWEHMKLLYWPLLLWAFAQRFFFREEDSYWCIKLAQLLLGLTLIPVLFYTLNGAFGETPAWVNIAIFYTSVAAAFLLEWFLFQKDLPRCRPRLALTLLLLTGAFFVIFTFSPPRLPLFLDPVTGTYGI